MFEWSLCQVNQRPRDRSHFTVYLLTQVTGKELGTDFTLPPIIPSNSTDIIIPLYHLYRTQGLLVRLSERRHASLFYGVVMRRQRCCDSCLPICQTTLTKNKHLWHQTLTPHQSCQSIITFRLYSVMLTFI